MSWKAVGSTIFSWLAMILLLASVTTPVTAQTYDCNKYADGAVRAQRFNQEHYCGFGGHEWSTNREGHRSWCLTAPYNDIIHDVQLRGKLLTACQTADQDCLAYSETAVAQNWWNRNMNNRGCEIFPCRIGHPKCEGLRWSDDRAAHQSWCRTVTPQQRRYETTARAKMLMGGRCVGPEEDTAGPTLPEANPPKDDTTGRTLGK